jgi:hypothetical protein
MLTARGGVGRKVVEPETLLIAAGAREAARVRSDRAERGAARVRVDILRLLCGGVAICCVKIV